jgi:hypothetical protein
LFPRGHGCLERPPRTTRRAIALLLEDSPRQLPHRLLVLDEENGGQAREIGGTPRPGIGSPSSRSRRAPDPEARSGSGRALDRDRTAAICNDSVNGGEPETQDRKIAEELTTTYQAQRAAQVERQTLERETAVANLQGDVVKSEQMVRISEKNALARAEVAKGEAAFVRAQAEAESAAVRMKGEAEAAAIRATGAAKAEAYRLGRESLGEAGYVATQMASILGENRVKLVPDIAVGGDGTTRLADVLVGKMLAASLPDATSSSSK